MNLDEFDPSKADFGDATEAGAPEPETEASPPSAEEPAAPVEEPKGEDLRTEEPKAEATPHMIPKHRLDYIQSKRREAEQRAAALEAELVRYRSEQLAASAPAPQAASAPQAQGPSPERNTLESQADALDRKIEEARADGDVDAAARLAREQRLLERRLRELELREFEQRVPQGSQMSPEHVITQIKQRDAIETMVVELTQQYPMLNSESPEYNQDLVDEILEGQSAFIALGQTPADAFRRSVGYVLSANGMLRSSPASATQQAPQPRKTDVSKNVDAANRTAPNLATAGLDSNKAGSQKKLDVGQMSFAEFEKLSEHEIAQLRGDFDV